jgi:hypothetical protein
MQLLPGIATGFGRSIMISHGHVLSVDIAKTRPLRVQKHKGTREACLRLSNRRFP